MLRYFLLIVWLYFPFSSQSYGQSAEELQGALRPERTCFDVNFYHLQLHIDPDKQQIQGCNAITFKVLKTTSIIQLDLYQQLNIDSVKYKDKKLAFKRIHNAFFITFPKTLPSLTTQTVTVFYSGKPPVDLGIHGDTGFHWDTDREKRHLVGVTCENTGASLWFPCKDHLSDEPDSVRLQWTFPHDLSCISNGVLEHEKTNSIKKLKTSTWIVKYPINNYNVTFYLGHYKKISYNFTSLEKPRTISCYYYTKDDVAKKFFDSAPDMIIFCEKLFGEYPYWNEKFALLQAPFRGMEHQTCINIGQKLILTDKKLDNSLLPFGLILIHEIAHEWWGNAVSVGDMADMWLHEGFATYVEILYLEHLYGNAYAEEHLESLQYNLPDNNVLGTRHIQDNVFRSYTIYGKGAKVIHLLRKEINNDEVFFNILKTYQSRFRHKIVYTEDFIAIVNEIANHNYTEFLMNHLITKK